MKLKPERYRHRLQPWLVCLSGSLFFFFIFIQMALFNALTPSLFRLFHLDVTQLGALSASYFYGTVLFLFPAGLILDWFSTRRVMLTVMGISVLCTIGFALSHSLMAAGIFRFLLGVTGSFCLLSNVRLASRWFPPHRMAFITGIIVTLAMIGGMVAQTPSTLLIDHLGLRSTLLIDALLGCLIFCIMFVFIRDYPRWRKGSSDVHAISSLQFWQSLRAAVRNSQNWLAGLYTSCMNLPIFLFGVVYGGLYLMQIHQLTRAQSSLVTSMLFFGMIIGCPLVGWISDQLRLRRLPMLIGAVAAFFLILLLLYSSALSYLLLLIIFFVLGAIISTQILSYPLVAESNSPAITATSESLASLLIMSGGFIQPLFGYLMKWHWVPQYREAVPLFSLGDYRIALLILPTAFTIAFIAALWIQETYCKDIS